MSDATITELLARVAEMEAAIIELRRHHIVDMDGGYVHLADECCVYALDKVLTLVTPDRAAAYGRDCTHSCGEGHFTGDDVVMLEQAAYGRGYTDAEQALAVTPAVDEALVERVAKVLGPIVARFWSRRRDGFRSGWYLDYPGPQGELDALADLFAALAGSDQ